MNFGLGMSSSSDISTSARERLEALSKNAQAKLSEAKAPARNQEWFQRTVVVPTAPIFIASTEDIGTDRVRANHLDAFHYCDEQIKLSGECASLIGGMIYLCTTFNNNYCVPYA